MRSGSMAHPSASARGGASSCSSSSLWFASSLHRSFSGSSFLLKPLNNRLRCEPYKQLRVQSDNSEIGIWDSSMNPKLFANNDNAATMKQRWVEETNKLNWLKLQHQLGKITVEELPVNINQGLENINGSNGSLRTHVMDKDTEESNIHQGLKNINGSNGSLRTHVTDKETEESSIPHGLKNINGSNGSLRTHVTDKETVESNIHQGLKNINMSNGSLRTHVMDKETEESNIHQGLKNINGSNGSLRTHVMDKETEESSIPHGLKNINGSNGSLRTHVTDKETVESNIHQGLKNINVSNGSLRTHVMDKETEESKDAPVRQLNSSKASQESFGKKPKDASERLRQVYNEVLVVDNIEEAKRVVRLLTTKYRNFIHGCDTEVAKIDVKQETPVNHGELICFSIYSHNSDMQADFGNGKPCIWVDVLDGERDVLKEFVPFFEDPLIKKVWHNYSFDSHIIENYGINLSGFHADTMHMARLWDSSRRLDGGYSLEALSGDSRVMSGTHCFPKSALNIGKISMKSIFGKKKIKKDGSEGKLVTMDSVENLQREERELWVSYSALDSISTLRLYESLKGKLEKMKWVLEGSCKGTMYDFYREYWSPFGALLVKMETEGMLVDRDYLSEIEKVAIAEQKMAADKFRDWASSYCADARHMNVGSDAQIRQLLFGGVQNNKNPVETLPRCRTFKIPNTENVIENGKKAPLKNRNITLCSLVENMQTESFTASGWPSVSGSALKSLAGKIPTELIYTLDEEESGEDGEVEVGGVNDEDEDSERSMYGAAYDAFGRGKKGKEACHAIAALCEMCSIDSLISNFILPLQGDHISCQNGRIHCSLNINTETGRLSARAPNLQNQPALEKDRYKIRQAFIAAPGKSLIVADYGQLELRILAHLASCQSMLDAFEAGGDFHSRTAMNMYDHIRKAVEEERVILEWHPQPGQEKPPVPLLKDAFGSERRKAKMLNFSIAYGKTPMGLARDWKVSLKEAKETVKLWYRERQEVLMWQQKRKKQAAEQRCVYTLLGRARRFPSMYQVSAAQRGHIERAAINTPVQGSAADVAMCAMLEIDRNVRLKELGWKLLLQVHDEVILEGPTESADLAKSIVVDCMSKPFYGTNFLKVDLSVDAKCAQNWYAAK